MGFSKFILLLEELSEFHLKYNTKFDNPAFIPNVSKEREKKKKITVIILLLLSSLSFSYMHVCACAQKKKRVS